MMKYKTLKFTIPQINVLSELRIPIYKIIQGFFLDKATLRSLKIEDIEYKAYRFNYTLKFRKLNSYASVPYTEVPAYCYINPNGDTIVSIEGLFLIKFKYKSPFCNSEDFEQPGLYLYSINHFEQKNFDIPDFYLLKFLQKFGLRFHDSDLISKIIMSYYKNKELTVEIINEITAKIRSLHRKVENDKELHYNDSI